MPSWRAKLIEISPLLAVEAFGEVGSRRVSIRYRGLLAKVVGESFLEPFSRILSSEKIAAWLGNRAVFSLYLPPIPSQAFKRLVVNNVKKQLSGKLPVGFAPDAVTIAITNSCPCRCVHCSAARRRRGEDLSFDELRQLIEDLVDMGTTNITFTGGEPMLRQDLPDLVACVDRDRAITQVFTSGAVCDESLISELAEKGLFALQVSLDSPNPAEHDKLRGVKGLFDKAVALIEEALKCGLLVGISTYASPEHIRSGALDEMYRLGSELGVHEITVFDLVPTGALIGEKPFLSEEDHQALIRWHIEKNSLPDGPRVSTMSFINHPKTAGCFGGYSQIHVTASGEVTPCDFTPLSFGNVRQRGIRAIWKKFRKHPEYGRWSPRCRMQNPEFRRKYVERIPPDAELPYPIELLDRS